MGSISRFNGIGKAFWAALLFSIGGGIALAANIADINHPIASATFVNIYWDSAWDADNPALTRGRIDAVATAVTQSTYFGGLAEYGVRTVTFGGSLLPNKACPQKAPNSVGFYDPANTSIAGFIQCEHDNEKMLQNSSVIYNIILPQSSLESDL